MSARALAPTSYFETDYPVSLILTPPAVPTSPSLPFSFPLVFPIPLPVPFPLSSLLICPSLNTSLPSFAPSFSAPVPFPLTSLLFSLAFPHLSSHLHRLFLEGLGVGLIMLPVLERLDVTANSLGVVAI